MTAVDQKKNIFNWIIDIEKGPCIDTKFHADYLHSDKKNRN